ncbi:SDR family oxidoreductase [Herbiconiux daphne]|uniref:NmrA family transcriptional regulator n=1 Tax=Herbiconiux daphne TaxID=2970914 RepID=A0ABT2H2I9_9MICO|nr:NmrA family transcriptional regulator [Herbiconiux daphne]MCS5734122.1 NmrA family transcriptional regulator [Herbiconiux daphne]
MTIVVVGGTGLIGTKVVARLRALGHDPVVAARATGVNSYTGEGLAEALAGAGTVVDVSNSSYLDEAGALDFFETSTLNLLTFGAAAAVAHHVALSVVGTDRLARGEGGYFQAKQQQENLIRSSSRPFSIVHATQFFEFVGDIADSASRDGRVRVAQALMQPMAADDVADAVVRTALGAPTRAVTEFAGPEPGRLDYFVRRLLTAGDDVREVRADPLARYFGSALTERELLPGDRAVLSSLRFDQWLKGVRPAAVAAG